MLKILMKPAMFIGLTIGSGNAITDPFYPCQSSTDEIGIFNVRCNNITVERVKTALGKKKNQHIGYFSLDLKNNKDQKIPANFIGNSSIDGILLRCTGQNSPLRVDSAAFSATQLYTKSLYISYCNLKYLNWSFLKGFSKLSSLTIDHSLNLHQKFYTLPTASLSSLNTVSFLSIVGLNGFNNTCLKFPPPPPKGLSYLSITECYDLGTAAVQNILSKWVRPTSTDTLKTLLLSFNTLTSIPSEIAKFNELNDVQCVEQKRPLAIQSGSFNFKKPKSSLDFTRRILDFSSSHITSISPGAFQGIIFYKTIVKISAKVSESQQFHTGYYENTNVYLSGNDLKTVSADVFRNMLIQMQSSSGFLLLIGSN